MEILSMQKEFWKIDELNGPIKDELINLVKLSHKACKILTYNMYVAAALIFTKGLILQELPLRLYNPNKYGLNFYTLFVIQILNIFMGILLIIGFDIIFIASCTNVIIQFKMIKYKLENIQFDDNHEDYDEGECRNQLVQCIKHKVKMNR